jgi:hypothetical protein
MKRQIGFYRWFFGLDDSVADKVVVVRIVFFAFLDLALVVSVVRVVWWWFLAG